MQSIKLISVGKIAYCCLSQWTSLNLKYIQVLPFGDWCCSWNFVVVVVVVVMFIVIYYWSCLGI